LITGPLTGIGRADAVAFAQEGANVVVTGRRDQAGKELVQELRALGFRKTNQRLRTCCAQPAEPADASAPLNLEDPTRMMLV
jgi:NAD(P)-dependent dehydrogenase (short-subunit alcohol dehydrogenase family)